MLTFIPEVIDTLNPKYTKLDLELLLFRAKIINEENKVGGKSEQTPF